MIAKPDIPEYLIRLRIEACDKEIAADRYPSMRSFWTKMKIGDMEALERWKAYRRQEIEKRARHQRPSVRRHITRRVKTPL